VAFNLLLPEKAIEDRPDPFVPKINVSVHGVQMILLLMTPLQQAFTAKHGFNTPPLAALL
jgi:hypothetical protein